ncbi:hypothetical protein AAG570_000414 [Ranatra chinensis]|uniref:Uncharacterized protein n=1 Tax=Ranatra chinensis TaxID=642074 RepID=A0ABD0Z9P2_9HEMI
MEYMKYYNSHQNNWSQEGAEKRQLRRGNDPGVAWPVVCHWEQSATGWVTMRIVLIELAVLCLAAGAPELVKYDQSQSGQLNIQLDLKNIEVVAVLEDLGLSSLENIDYGDYSELTLKPPSHSSSPQWSLPTSVPAGTTPAQSSEVGVSTEATNSSGSEGTAGVNPVAASEVSDSGTAAEAGNSGVPTEVTNSGTSAIGSSSTATGGPVVATPATKKCATGYYRDRTGRCKPNQKPANNS